MNRLARFVRQMLTIARRDFVATVVTPTFLFFLLSPVIMLSFGLVGGMGASGVGAASAAKQRTVVLAAGADAAALKRADQRLRPLFGGDSRPATLIVEPPAGDPAAQARAAFGAQDYDAAAVLYGPLAHPTILYGGQGFGDARYLAGLAEATARDRASGIAEPLSQPVLTPFARATASAGGHSQAAFFAVFGVFFLSLLLSGQAVGTMAEERNNKVIEILAAAIPLEAVFLGKLVGMFGSALLFLAFWGVALSQLGQLLPSGVAGALGEIGPAIGLATFVPLFCSYFAMAYMLLGAVFLGVGAQATTPRELQMLSLPITITQVGMFALASAAAGKPGSGLARFAEIFPLSSPFAMAGHAATSPALWPHLLALAWQALWVLIAVTLGAMAFRRGVMKSAGVRPSRRRKREL